MTQHGVEEVINATCDINQCFVLADTTVLTDAVAVYLYPQSVCEPANDEQNPHNNHAVYTQYRATSI
jgi:hypothetical protein